MDRSYDKSEQSTAAEDRAEAEVPADTICPSPQIRIVTEQGLPSFVQSEEEVHPLMAQTETPTEQRTQSPSIQTESGQGTCDEAGTTQTPQTGITPEQRKESVPAETALEQGVCDREEMAQMTQMDREEIAQAARMLMDLTLEQSRDFSSIRSELDQGSCSWKMPPKKRVEMEVGILEDNGQQEPERTAELNRSPSSGEERLPSPIEAQVDQGSEALDENPIRDGNTADDKEDRGTHEDRNATEDKLPEVDQPPEKQDKEPERTAQFNRSPNIGEERLSSPIEAQVDQGSEALDENPIKVRNAADDKEDRVTHEDRNATEDKLPEVDQPPEEQERDVSKRVLSSQSKTHLHNRQGAAKLASVTKLKEMHLKIEKRQQGIRPHVCRVCRLVVWGKPKRYRQHVKLHGKLHRKPRKRTVKIKSGSKSQQKTPVISRLSKRLASKKQSKSKERPTRDSVLKQTHRTVKPQRVKTASARKRISSSGKGANGASSSTKRKSIKNEKELVSVPVPSETNAKGGETVNPCLYLCAKCCNGFSDVMELVAHVTVCSGMPVTASVDKPDLKSENKKSAKEPAAGPNAGGARKTRPKRKVVVKTEEAKTKETKKLIDCITSKQRRKPKVVRRLVEKIKGEKEDSNNNADWTPQGGASSTEEGGSGNVSAGDDGDEDWKPEKKTVNIRIKKEKIDHICSECGNVFAQASALKRHMYIHSVRPMSHHCQFCRKAYTRTVHLKTHMKTVHPDVAFVEDDFKVKKEPKADVRKGRSKEKVRRDRKKYTKSMANPNNECSVCHKTFSHYSALYRHKHLHSGVRKHQCDLCNMRFTQSCHLKSHIKKVHLREGREDFKCNYCDEAFVHVTTLKMHLMKHAEQNPFECNICRARFTRESFLERHMVKIHEGKPVDASFTTCNECGKTFSFPSSLRRHKLLHWGIKKHECPNCHKQFTQKCHFNRHKCNGPCIIEEKSKLCMACGKIFSTAYIMRNHELSVHAETKDFKCPTCNKGFATSGHLKIHVNGAHGVGNHLCHQCGKSFSFKSSYLRHLKYHTGVKPYKCQFCERTFTQSSHCKAHAMTHIQTEKVQCQYCGKKFKNPRNHRHHVKVHHTGDSIVFKCFRCGDEFNFAEELAKHMDEKCNREGVNTLCKICDKAFPTNSHLVRHMRTHTNERPFQCTICDKSFTQNSHLKNHILRHSKIKAWQCEVCGRSYASREYLKHHVKKLHEERPDGQMPIDAKKKKRTDCEICGKVYKNRKYLKVHLKRKHADLLYKQEAAPSVTAPSTAAPKNEPKPPSMTVAQEKVQNIVIYPNDNLNRVPIPVPLELHNIPQTSAVMPTQPSTAYQLHPEMHPKDHPPPPPARKPEEAGPNMIAESMRLITVNWW